MSLTLRPSSALKLLLDVAEANVRGGEPDLSFRQLSVLLTVYLKAAPHSVTRMASHLKVSKPVVTRALDHLAKIGLIVRARDPKDQRKLVITRTVEGALFLDRLALMTIAKAENLPHSPVVFTPSLVLDDNDLEKLSRMDLK
jgi:DNA-binding MarR family transcriptional regulator